MDALTGRIVVGYDGSPAACAAVDWATDEARRRGLPLTVLHVVDYVGMLPNVMGPAGWPAAFAGEAAKVATVGADRARRRAPEIGVLGVTRTAGIPGALIEASYRATLLVLGFQGRTALTAARLGSVTATVTGHSHCPVAVVRGDTARRAGPDRPVVVGFDGSPGAVAAVRYAADVAAQAGAPLQVISAYRPVSTWHWSGGGRLGRPLPDEHRAGHDAVARETAREAALGALRIAREQHSRLPATQRAVGGPTVQVLSDAAEPASLLVVGSRGRGGFAGLLLGSVGHGLIRAAPCPVVVVHASPADLADPSSPEQMLHR